MLDRTSTTPIMYRLIYW